MKLALALLAVILTGCASAQPAALGSTDEDFRAQPQYATKSITIVPVDDVSEVCRSAGLDQNKRFLGCSKYNNRSCTIYISRTSRHSILGHELRHCFEGQWH